MLLLLLSFNVISHNCDDIIFKIVCDSHDKCLWKNYNCIDTTLATSTSSTKSYSAKKLSGKKSSYKYSTTTTTTEEPGHSLSKSKKTKVKSSIYTSSTSTTSHSETSSTSTSSSSTTTSSTSSTSVTSSTSETSSDTSKAVNPPIGTTSENSSDTSLVKSGKKSSTKNIIIPSVISGCLSFLVVIIVYYRRKRKNSDSGETYLEPVSNNPAYTSPVEAETNGVLYALAKTGDGKPIYDLSYEEISNERATYEIPEPAYNLAQDLPMNKSIITESEYDIAEEETGYFEVGNENANYELAT